MAMGEFLKLKLLTRAEPAAAAETDQNHLPREPTPDEEYDRCAQLESQLESQLRFD